MTTTEIPEIQTAVVIDLKDGGKAAAKDRGRLPLGVSHSVAVPRPSGQSPYHVLVRVLAVALNPNDHKMAEHFPIHGVTAGCDFCGIIVATAPTVKPASPGIGTKRQHSTSLSTSPLQRTAPHQRQHSVGTRVCGAAFPYRPGGGDTSGGSFAQYMLVDSRLLVRVPDSWSDLEAAALGGVGWSTLAMAFSDPEALALQGRPSRPTEKRAPVLVYGGATATGTLACQLLGLSGYDPIAVASTSSAPLALKYGAVGVTAYSAAPSSTACAADVRALAGGPKNAIRLALDCITDAGSASVCFEAMGRTGGRYACLEQLPDAWRTRRAVRVKEVMGFEVLGVDVDLGPNTTYTRFADPQLHALGVEWAEEIERLAEAGLVRTHPICEVVAPGSPAGQAGKEGEWWDRVLDGLGRLQRGEVRGQKLVVRVATAANAAAVAA